ncbi:hypothetical protein OESDEN_14586 [Oesophagostomum dentatum]|uniref:DSBA-like thioredoxin domain-containing protein n=1 Tax=Oesophagostomum dentatum TaxID=61180 RepID=A0A0B1SP90_OESDE|nr:hypothetical protein OESDEN_14586 [Oesophagostomum dentatum]
MQSLACVILLTKNETSTEKLEAASRELWKRIWSNGEPIFEREDFEKVLVACGVRDASRLIDKIGDATIEAELEQNTLDAVNLGVS